MNPMEPKQCPHCNADLDGEDIYEYFLRIYSGNEKKAMETAELFGWAKEHPISFRLTIGEYDLEQDRTIGHRCPVCDTEIPSESN